MFRKARLDRYANDNGRIDYEYFCNATPHQRSRSLYNDKEAQRRFEAALNTPPLRVAKKKQNAKKKQKKNKKRAPPKRD
ncbi:MAG TPA: hypothetical protein VFP60_06155 [Pseudolabrys sp.]|nr:hypothetical protein [Pseudolabrys sp.]